MSDVVHVDDLTVEYGSHKAVDGVNLSIPRGRVLGLLGHNGAGKTSLVRCLATLIPMTSGKAHIAGFDVHTEPKLVRQHIALAGQYAAVDELLSGRTNLVMIARLRHVPRNQAEKIADELLEEFDLVDAAQRSVGTYSGGMRRRLDLAACLVTKPSVLFLDEPTTGLDPASRLTLWQSVRRLVAEGVTVLLTTQYLEEAETLADNIILMNHGRVVVQGTVDQLKESVGTEKVVLEASSREELNHFQGIFGSLPNVSFDADVEKLALTATSDEPLQLLHRVSQLAYEQDLKPRSVSLRKPSLDEVYFAVAGA